MDARVWWCVLCVAVGVSTGSVRWQFCALSNSYVRLLCHLAGFHEVGFDEIMAAEHVGSDITGVLLTRPHRHLGAWMKSGAMRDDCHRVGNWESSVFKRHQLTEHPPRRKTPRHEQV